MTPSTHEAVSHHHDSHIGLGSTVEISDGDAEVEHIRNPTDFVLTAQAQSRIVDDLISSWIPHLRSSFSNNMDAAFNECISDFHFAAKQLNQDQQVELYRKLKPFRGLFYRG